MKREQRELQGKGRIPAYPKGPMEWDTQKYQGDKPLKTRLGKTASDFRVEPSTEDNERKYEKLVEETTKVSLENIRLQEEIQRIAEEYEKLEKSFDINAEEQYDLMVSYEAIVSYTESLEKEIKVLRSVISDIRDGE